MVGRILHQAGKKKVEPRYACLLLVFHVLMLEEGFTSLDVECSGLEVYGHDFSRDRVLKYIDLTLNTPEGIRNSILFELRYILLPFMEYKCTLIVCFPETDQHQNLVLVNLKGGGIQTRAICVDLNKHIRITLLNGNPNFLAMKDLSMKFKNTLTGPFREQLLCNVGARSRYCAILNLPEHVCILVIRLLRPSDVANLALTCKEMHGRCEDSTLWHYLYLRDFKHWVNPTCVQTPRDLIDWRSEYRERLEEERETEEQMINRQWKRRFAVILPAGTLAAL